MMPTYSVHGGWLKSGEIDIMEHVGYMPDKVHFTVHREKGSLGTAISLSDVTADFHVYALEWSKDKLD
jgi:beta-glucanase (GH16 family)